MKETKKIILSVEDKDKNIYAEKIKFACSFLERGIGLMFKPGLGDFGGMLLKPCNSVHTCFMKFSLDIVFLDKNLKVVSVIEQMKPWRFSRMYFRANQVLELKGGTIKGRLKPGDQLRFNYV